MAPLVNRNMQPTARNLRDLINFWRDGQINMTPPYQRGDVWTETQRVHGASADVRHHGDMVIRTGVRKGLRDAHCYARQAQLRGGTAQVVKTGTETVVATYPRPMHLGPKAHRQTTCTPHPSTVAFLAIA